MGHSGTHSRTSKPSKESMKRDEASFSVKTISMKKPLPKKHMKTAKELNKKRRMDMIVKKINSWLVPGTTIAPEILEQIINCIKQLSFLMGFHFNKQLVVATMIYVEKFVERKGQVNLFDIFDLLVVASIITMKFWAEEQYRVDMELTSYVSGIPKKQISSMERSFLGTIEYSLFLDSKTLEEWQLQHNALDLHNDSNILFISPPPTPPSS